MKIGILGTGHIGKTLVQKLSAAGHDVKVANSRGPETIEADVLAFGGRAVTAAEAVVNADVVILSWGFPMNSSCCLPLPLAIPTSPHRLTA
jgi:predicted dinucleotide-binding enzyme